MTAIAGLWRFDGRPDAADGCRRMLPRKSMGRISPDNGLTGARPPVKPMWRAAAVTAGGKRIRGHPRLGSFCQKSILVDKTSSFLRRLHCCEGSLARASRDLICAPPRRPGCAPPDPGVQLSRCRAPHAVRAGGRSGGCAVIRDWVRFAKNRFWLIRPPHSCIGCTEAPRLARSDFRSSPQAGLRWAGS
jgi:hypothetical protein